MFTRSYVGTLMAAWQWCSEKRSGFGLTTADCKDVFAKAFTGLASPFCDIQLAEVFCGNLEPSVLLKIASDKKQRFGSANE